MSETDKVTSSSSAINVKLGVEYDASHTKGLNLWGTLVYLEGDIGLVQEHAHSQSSETCADDKDLGVSWRT